jgi:hypothetical protein
MGRLKHARETTNDPWVICSLFIAAASKLCQWSGPSVILDPARRDASCIRPDGTIEGDGSDRWREDAPEASFEDGRFLHRNGPGARHSRANQWQQITRQCVVSDIREDATRPTRATRRIERRLPERLDEQLAFLSEDRVTARARSEDGPVNGQTCVICSALFQEFGHSAEPVKRGRCCNLCNDAVVIPERIRLMRLQDETVHKVQRDREPS